MMASSRLHPGSGPNGTAWGPRTAELERATPVAVASALRGTLLADPEPELVLHALSAAVDGAMYWQEPSGEDVLSATPAVREALERVASHVTGAPGVTWWADPIARDDQHQVTWAGEATPDQTSAAGRLARWRADVAQQEERARRERPSDPTAQYSGEWWSTPPFDLLRSTRSRPGYGPLGLWLVEDSQGWDQATTRAVSVPEHARVHEVDGAEAWAELCRAHPVEVTAQKRHDWYRATGRAGRWVVPDWAAVAGEHDAVHLTTAAYLTEAGTPIPMDDDTASVIANWNPDETYWLGDAPVPAQAATHWGRDGASRWTHPTR
jgi:hypothetical protein